MSDSSGKPGNPGPQKPSGSAGGDPRKVNFSSMTLILLVAAVLVSIFAWTSSPTNHGNTVPYSFFYSQLQKNQVRNVTFHGEVLTGRWKQIPAETPEGLTGTLVEQFNTVLPPVQLSELEPELRKNSVPFNASPIADVGLGNLFFWVLMPLLFVFLMWNMLRRSADPFGAGGMMGGFIRSPARRFEKNEKSAKRGALTGS